MLVFIHSYILSGLNDFLNVLQLISCLSIAVRHFQIVFLPAVLLDLSSNEKKPK